MPATPVTWLEEFNVTLTTSPQDPDIIQLANGNILVAWSTADDTPPGDTAGEDIVGQIFDPLGNPVGAPIRLNTAFVVDNERDPDLAATPDGGFVMVYEDSEAGFGTSLRLQRYDANGVPISTVTIEFDANAGAPFFANPHVAVSSATSALVVYEEDGGGGRTVVGRIYNPTTDTLGPQIPLIAFPGGDTQPDVTALTNGNYVITATHNDGGDERIIYRIVDSSGNNVLGVTPVIGTSGDGFDDDDASVTALAGGGFVITFTDRDGTDTDVEYRVYNAAGTEVGAGFAGSSPGTITNNNNEPVVSGLVDGNFVIVVDNDEADTMEVTHVSATGTVLGTLTFSGPGTNPAVTDLGDGRFAVTWQVIGGGVRMEILDTRDLVNNPAVYTPVSQQIGTIGADVFTVDPLADQVFGHTGNDVITGSSDTDSINGGDGNDTVTAGVGNDTIIGGAGNDRNIWNNGDNTDTFDGGDGTDTQEVNGAALGDTFTLSASGGVALFSRTNLVPFDVSMTSVEGIEVRGLDGDDSFTIGNLTGTSLAAGTILFDGGNGNDTLNASASVTAVTALGGAGTDNLTGSSAADTIDGGADVDQMSGGLGNDTYVVDNVGDVVTEAVGGGTDLVQSSVSFTLGAEVDNLTLTGTAAVNGTGNVLGNVIVGNSAANTLLGLDGNDTLSGGEGNDTLVGGRGADILSGEGGADTFEFNSKNDSKKGALRDTVNFGDGDTIDLSGIDAAKGKGFKGDQAFEFVDEDNLAAKFTDEAGQLRLKRGVLSGDINGDGKADFQIRIVGTLTADDVIL